MEYRFTRSSPPRLATSRSVPWYWVGSVPSLDWSSTLYVVCSYWINGLRISDPHGLRGSIPVTITKLSNSSDTSKKGKIISLLWITWPRAYYWIFSFFINKMLSSPELYYQNQILDSLRNVGVHATEGLKNCHDTAMDLNKFSNQFQVQGVCDPRDWVSFDMRSRISKLSQFL